jgi:hypothetical protein
VYAQQRESDKSKRDGREGKRKRERSKSRKVVGEFCVAAFVSPRISFNKLKSMQCMHTLWRRDSQRNDTQHNDTWRDATHHNGKKSFGLR